jgi:L-rhamnose mutarotase
MKILAYRDHGSIYFDEIRNDYDAINEVLEQSDRIAEIDDLINSLVRDNSETALPREEFDRRWNEYMMKMIEVLVENGYEILWC